MRTDLGQDYNPDPVRGLVTFCGGLLRGGFEVSDLKVMLHQNQRGLLGG